MSADDTEGAAIAPTVPCTHTKRHFRHRQHISVAYLVFALALLTAQIASARPRNDDHNRPGKAPGDEFKPFFGPHLHGPDVLPDGSQWLLFQEHWRVIGDHLTTPNFTSALENAAGIIYSQYSFHGIYAGSHRSHAAPVFLDGQPVSPVEMAQDSFSRTVLSDYNSLDVALDVSIDNRAWWPDLGSVSQNDHHRLTNLMQSDGFDVKAWLCLGYTLTSKGAMIMSHMPIPMYQSHLVHLEVTGANLVPFALEKQNLVMTVLTELLAFASVFSVRLIRVEQQSVSPGQDISTASLFLVAQQDMSGLFMPEAIDQVIIDPLGTPLFDAHMAAASLPVTAALKRWDPFPGDSITDQIDHDPGRPPWSQPWEVSIITLGAVGIAVITCFSAYVCNKRIVKPLLLQRIWARRQRKTQGRDVDIEMAQGGLQGLSQGGRQQQDFPRKSALTRLKALLSPASLQYSALPDQLNDAHCPEPLDHSNSPLGHARSSRQDPHGLPPATVAASKEMACASQVTETTTLPPEVGVVKGVRGEGSGLTHETAWGNIAGWNVDPNQITICEHPVKGGPWQLGSGSYGVVYKAKRGLQDVAVKTLHSHLVDPEVSPAQAHDNICRELKVLKRALTNPELVMRQEVSVLKGLSYDTNVVQFYGSCVKDGKILLVLEYMEGGDLKHALKSLGNRSRQLQWYRMGSTIALDVIKGIHFFHTHGVLHRDIKSANVLLSKAHDQAKICDVGLAHIIGTTGNISSANQPMQGTFAYCSPEMLFNKRCREAADIYSFGVVLWEIITQETPQRGNLRDLEVPDECPQEIADLVDRCLDEIPESRPSALEVYNIITQSRLMHPIPPNPH